MTVASLFRSALIGSVVVGAVFAGPVSAQDNLTTSPPSQQPSQPEAPAEPTSETPPFESRGEMVAYTALEGDCPALTNSITRLYSAYFLRDPEQGGFEFWVDEYRTGRWSLGRMSNFFSQSDEFDERYGALDNAGFVDLIYQNVHGRVPDADGRAYWIGRLDAGSLDRGDVMLFFSESEEYVTATGTWAPLAGYLRNYPEGTTFSCGTGSELSWTITTSGYSDLLVHYRDDGEIDVSVEATGYNPAYRLVNDIYYVKAIRHRRPSTVKVTAEDTVHWTLVSYPTAMPNDRPGWGF